MILNLRKLCALVLLTMTIEGLVGGEVKIINPNLDGPTLPKEIVLPRKAPWKADKGCLRSPDYSKGGMSSFKIGNSDWADYDINFKLRCLDRHPKDQHFGFSVRKGVKVYTRGKRWIIHIPEKKIHASFGKPFTVPLPVGSDSSWTDFAISIKGAALTIKVDGETVASRDDIPEGTGLFSFYSFRNYLEIKDLSIRVYKTGNSEEKLRSPNIALNASFEKCTLGKLPDYWGIRHWGIDDPEIILNYVNWYKTFQTDDSTAWHGKRSMRLENNTDAPFKDSRIMWSCNFGTKVDSTYTMSAYMKADRPGVKVGLKASPYSQDRKLEKIVTLTKDWKRYEYTYKRTRNSLYTDMLYFALKNRGIVWIDAVQLEQGTKATPFQMANSDAHLTVHEGNVEKTLHDVPINKTPLLKEKPCLDGILNESLWRNVPSVKLKSVYGKEVKEKSSAKIFYTPEGIYIGIDADEANSDQIKCRKKDRDEYVWSDPSFEIFVDSKLTRGTYHHLAFNADGVQYDANFGNTIWNGDWQVKTARKTDNSGWTAEVFIPFSCMDIDFNNGPLWGFNLCRNNPQSSEISCWAPTYGRFHEPLRFGQLTISELIQKNFLAGVRNFSLKYAGKDKNELSAEVFNNTGHKINAVLACRVTPLSSGISRSFEKKISIPDGKTSNMVLGTVPGKTSDRFSVAIILQENSRKIETRTETISGVRVLHCIPQLDYCSREKEMPLRIRTELNPELLKKLTAVVTITNGKNVVYKEDVRLTGVTLEKKLSVGKWDDGNYTVVCRLLDGTTEIAKSESTFQKLPPSSHEVKLDRFRRITLVNGKPFFPLGIFWEGRPTPAIIELLSKGNVNTVHIYGSATNELLDAGQKYGVMFQLDVHARKGQCNDVIRKWKNHPAVLSWYTYDEAFTTKWGRTHLAEVQKTIADGQLVDPYRPVVMLENIYGMNYVMEKGLRFPGKIPILDYYAYPPLANVQLWNNYSKKILSLGEQDGRPGWAVPFMSGYGFHASRDMSPSELEYQVYICAINGIRGIIFWASYPKAPTTFSAITSLFGEMRQLVDPLISLENAPEIRCNAADIKFTVKRQGEYVYLITVNESKKPVQARFDVSTLGNVKNVQVLFENRTIPVTTNCLKDSYKGLQRHVYRFKTIIH